MGLNRGRVDRAVIGRRRGFDSRGSELGPAVDMKRRDGVGRIGGRRSVDGGMGCVVARLRRGNVGSSTTDIRVRLSLFGLFDRSKPKKFCLWRNVGSAFLLAGRPESRRSIHDLEQKVNFSSNSFRRCQRVRILQQFSIRSRFERIAFNSIPGSFKYGPSLRAYVSDHPIEIQRVSSDFSNLNAVSLLNRGAVSNGPGKVRLAPLHEFQRSWFCPCVLLLISRTAGFISH
jgi:hypothetical protein